MESINQILQAWAENVPESAALSDELKLKLAQAAVDAVDAIAHPPKSKGRGAPDYPPATPPHLRT